MNKYPFLKTVILRYLIEHQSLTGYEIIKYCRANGLSASSGTIYPHLKALKEKNIIDCRVSGKKKIYHLTEEGLKKVADAALTDTPEFIKNLFLKSLGVILKTDWKSKESIDVLLSGFTEVQKTILSYRDQLE